MADDWGASFETDCYIAYVCSLIKKTLHHFIQFSKNQTPKQKKNERGLPQILMGNVKWGWKTCEKQGGVINCSYS